jgi:cold shock CspA family protein
MSNDLKRERGRVQSYKSSEGYGSIKSAEFNDVLFVHFSSIVQDSGFRALSDGQTVECTRAIQPGPNGVRAVAVDVVPLP